jgi:hypothetical protein
MSVLGDTVMMLLAAPSMPEEVREDVEAAAIHLASARSDDFYAAPRYRNTAGASCRCTGINAGL